MGITRRSFATRRRLAHDGRRLATGGDDGSIVLWELGNGAEKVLCRGLQSPVLPVAFSPDGATLATGHTDSKCVLWDVTTGKKRAMLRGHTGAVISLDFSPDGAILASGGSDSTSVLIRSCVPIQLSGSWMSRPLFREIASIGANMELRQANSPEYGPSAPSSESQNKAWDGGREEDGSEAAVPREGDQFDVELPQLPIEGG